MEGNDEDEPTLNSAIRVLCPCLTCQGTRRVSKRTMYWHMQKMVDPVARLGNPLVEEVAILDGPSQDTSTNIFEFSPPSSTSREPSQCSDQHLVGPVKVVTFKQALTNKIVELQEKWDVSQVPINLQDYMLHQLFGSLQEEPNVFEDGRLDYGALPIGRLLIVVGLEPELIRGFSLPTSWKQLHNLYRELGLVAIERWRFCIGSTQAPHVPHLMSPSVEDLYEGFEVVHCECGPNSGQNF